MEVGDKIVPLQLMLLITAGWALTIHGFGMVVLDGITGVGDDLGAGIVGMLVGA